MSVATASAVLRLRLSKTISRALPRLTAAMAQAQPTLPVPIMPIFMSLSFAGALHSGKRTAHSLAIAGRLEQGPGATLGLVDPVLDQAGAGHVVVLLANRVGLAQARGQLLVIVAQLRKHIQRRDEVSVVVQDSLQAADVADRVQRSAADLADALGDGVGGRENLLAMVVEEEMIVAEVGTGYMPMEILGLQVKRKHIGEQDIERAGNLRHGVGAQVGRSIERSDPQRGGIPCFRHFYLLLT